MTIDEILGEHPQLKREDILAALVDDVHHS
jgi:hypothetical protein